MLANYIDPSAASDMIARLQTSVSQIYSTFIIPVIGFNGILEAIVAGVLTAAVASALLVMNKNG